MAKSKILDYDGEFITYYYDRHEDVKRVEVKIHAFDFIKKLIIHIPEKGFNMVRYYGIDAMKKSVTSHFKKIKEKLSKPCKRIDKLSAHFKCNSLQSSCGNTLKFQFIVQPKFQKLFELCFPNLL